MACFGGGGGGGSGAKAALNVAADPQISSKAFLEVELTLGNANSRESTLLLNRQGEYLPGAPDAAGAKRPPKQPKLPAGKFNFISKLFASLINCTIQPMTTSKISKMLSRLSKFLRMRSRATKKTLTRSRPQFQSTMSFTCRHPWSTMLLLIQWAFNWSQVGTTPLKLSPHTHQVASSAQEDATTSNFKSR